MNSSAAAAPGTGLLSRAAKRSLGPSLCLPRVLAGTSDARCGILPARELRAAWGEKVWGCCLPLPLPAARAQFCWGSPGGRGVPQKPGVRGASGERGLLSGGLCPVPLGTQEASAGPGWTGERVGEDYWVLCHVWGAWLNPPAKTHACACALRRGGQRPLPAPVSRPPLPLSPSQLLHASTSL